MLAAAPGWVRAGWRGTRAPVDIPEEVLLRRVERGEDPGRTAEAELCRRYAPRIRLYGLRHLRDAAGSDDLVQIVLLAVLQALRAGRVDDRSKFDRFVLGTCRNSALRMRQQAARLSLAPSDELPPLAIEPREVVEPGALQRCLQHLTQRAQRVLVLSFYDEHSAEEIANELHTSAPHVRVLRHRALASVRECLDAGPQP
jgi:RNA polymerase sigma-70 factor, ECF subfamily